jgi:hypothetical protein
MNVHPIRLKGMPYHSLSLLLWWNYTPYHCSSTWWSQESSTPVLSSWTRRPVFEERVVCQNFHKIESWPAEAGNLGRKWPRLGLGLAMDLFLCFRTYVHR